jgi:S1-C subfamily serine protease
MNGLHEDFQPIAGRLQRMADFLYGQAHDQNEVGRDEITVALHDMDPAEVDELIQKLDAKEIVLYDAHRNRVLLRSRGRYCYTSNCIPEVVLGLQYCAEKYSSAVVRIAVEKPDGSLAAGTGFFISDVPNRVITNRHVTFNNQIQRIEDQNGNVLHAGHLPSIAGPEDLDLAAIECPMPGGVMPLRLDWEDGSLRRMDEVLVLGYPYVAHHYPALLHAQGRIGMRAKRMSSPEQAIRESLLLTDVAAPGCSGGPVISVRGMVVGVIEQQSVAHAAGAAAINFVGALPSFYLREILPR